MLDDFVLLNSDTLTLWLFFPAEANYRPGRLLQVERASFPMMEALESSSLDQRNR